MKVAIVHDWLTGVRGGERVLASICRILPNADIFTLFHFPEKIGGLVAGHRVTASRLNMLPGAGRCYRYLLPLMPGAVEEFDLSGYDLVVSSSHAVAKGARVTAGVPHICYCHSPMRYAWDNTGQYFRFGRLRHVRKALLGVLKHRLQAWDLRANRTVTQFIANSDNIRRRIEMHYSRQSAVIYPPVDTEFFTPSAAARDDGYYLVVSALEPYKRVELAIGAAQRANVRLVVAGTGSQLKPLRRFAGRNAEFTGRVTDEELRTLYRNCRALLFPGIEDFGIVPVEAQACGKPVIAFGQGGCVETILPGRTGVFFHEQSEQAVVAAMHTLDAIKFDPQVARQNSLRFARARFEQDFAALMARFIVTPEKVFHAGQPA